MRNKIFTAGTGIDISSDYSSVIENYCIDSYSGGIYVAGVDVCIVNNSCFKNKGKGILHSGDNANITGNICRRNRERGIYVHTSHRIIAYNNYSENGGYGIDLGSTSESQVFGNYLFANRKGSFFDDEGSENDIHNNLGDAADIFGVLILAILIPSIVVTLAVIYKLKRGRKKLTPKTPADLS